MFFTGKQRIGIIKQSKTGNHWNAIAVDGAAFKTLLYEAGAYPEQDIKTDVLSLSSQTGTLPNRDRVYLNMKSGLAKLSFNAPATRDTLHYHLAAVCQSVVQAGIAPYKKTFKVANATNLLNVANNEGWLHTLAGDIAGGDGWKLGNAVLDELVITIEKDAEGINRLVKLSGTWVGSELQKGKTLNGTWESTSLVNNLFGDSITNNIEEFSINGVFGNADLELSNTIVKKIEIRISNNVSVPYRTAAGRALNYLFNPEVRWSISLINNNTTKNILKIIEDVFSGVYNPANAYININNGYGASTTGYLEISLFNVLPDANPIATENNLFIVNLSGVALKGTDDPIVIELVDNINGGY